tara:strand:+ start:468 stop:1103 length:636 start_codon:yes stop_codon:yes gene_type:complete
MALVIKDRVKETTETDGTGTLSLAGAATGFQSFVAAVGNGNTTYYAIEDANGSAWEVGIGTITDGSPDTLARTTILASSNSGSVISLTTGSHTVFGTYPAGKAIFLDANGVLTLSKSTVVPYTTITTDTTVTSSNVAVFANATSGAIDVTLYAATSNGGKTLTIKKTDSSSNTVDIIRAGGETIDGVTTITLSHQNESITLMSDNSNWFIV